MKGRSTKKEESRLPDAKPVRKFLIWGLDNPALRGLLLVGLVGVVVSLLAPYQFNQSLPLAGSVSQRTIYATHGFDVIRNNPQYEELVQREEGKVLPAYSYQPSMGDSMANLLQSRFREARAVLQNHTQEVAELKAAYEGELQQLRRETDEGLESPDNKVTPTEAALMREELAEKSAAAGERYQAQVAEATRRRASQLEEVREAFPREDLASKISTEDFQALLENEFPEAGEAALLSALRTTLSGRIVRDLEVRRLEDDLRRGIQVSEDGRAAKPVRGVLDFVGEDTARQEARESLRRKLLAVDVDFSLEVQRAFTTLVELLVAPNFSYDSRATVELKVEAARNVPRESTESYKKGQVVLRGGEQVTPFIVSVLTRMNETGTATQGKRTWLGILAFVLSLLLLFWVLVERGTIQLWKERKDAVFFGLVLVSVLALIKASLVLTTGFLQVWHGVPESALLFGIPFALGPMLVRLFLGVPAATAFALILCGLVGVLVQDESVGGLAQFLPQTLVFYSLVSGLIGAYSMFEIRERSTLLRASFIVGVTNVITGAVFLMLHGVDFLAEGLWVMGGGLFGGVSTYVFLMALIPAYEGIFRYTTDIKLLELANMNHPSLKELAIRAPGTYHHSIMVGNLAEAAAEAIGANPLFARVGAYYHDLGKMRNPRYFAENQGGENPHDKLRPSMSALIVKSHVKDGVEIAKQYRLPQAIIDFIPQHHGTSLIKFFYVRASEMAEEGQTVDEEDFRYAGPKPQRIETALVMLADGVEASARSLPDPNPARLKGLVNKIVRTQFIDGQLDECDLSFRDLNVIVQSFNRVLNGMYHGRPEYPNMPDKEKDGGGLNLSRIEHHGANSGSIAFDDAADSLKSER